MVGFTTVMMKFLKAICRSRAYGKRNIRGNLTGTANAYRPAGALESGGVRAAATGDYEAWNPAEAE